MKNRLNKNQLVTKKFQRDNDDEFDDDFAPQSKRDNHPSELDLLLSQELERPQNSGLAELKVGAKVKCELLAIAGEELFFSIQSQSARPRDGVLGRRELLDKDGALPYRKGDHLDLYVIRTKGGIVTLSASPLAKGQAEDLLDAYKTALPIEGKVTEVCKGGVRVSIRGKSAFCPIGQLDTARVENPESYVGQKFNFIISELSEGGRNIVVSRRKLLASERALSEKVFLQERKEGDIVEGVVKRIEPFGAFVEIAPSIEGLVHISEISYSRVNTPQEVLSLGQKVKAKILKCEQTQTRPKISLSIKQVEDEPWNNILDLFKEREIVRGKVSRCLKFGAIVEISPGIEGLVPLSEMSHTKRITRSNELFKEGDSILVMIKEIHPESKKLLLSSRDIESDPWSLVEQKFPLGTIVSGKVNRREAYGLFVELEEGITGLLPKSSTRDNENPDFNYDKIKLSDVIHVQIMEVNPHDRRISLAPPQDPNKDEWKNHLPQEKSQAKSSKKGSLADKLKGFKV